MTFAMPKLLEVQPRILEPADLTVSPPLSRKIYRSDNMTRDHMRSTIFTCHIRDISENVRLDKKPVTAEEI